MKRFINDRREKESSANLNVNGFWSNLKIEKAFLNIERGLKLLEMV